MGIIKNEDIKWYQIGEGIVCVDCSTDDDLKEITEGDVHTEEDDESMIFCDRCKKQI